MKIIFNKIILITISIIFVFCIINISFSNEIYKWTYKSGTVHFTNNSYEVPESIANNKIVINELDSKNSNITNKIIGVWSNNKNRFETLTCTFKEDGTGVMFNSIGIGSYFNWNASDNIIEIKFKSSNINGNSLLNESKVIKTIIAIYQLQTNTIKIQELQNDDKEGLVLYKTVNHVQTESELIDKKEKNKKEYMEKLTRSAENGNKDAAFRLGEHYLYGTGGFIKDIPEALKWIRYAAEANVPDAQQFLGHLLFYGNERVTIDRDEAILWMRKSSANGNKQAQAWLDWYENQSAKSLKK